MSSEEDDPPNLFGDDDTDADSNYQPEEEIDSSATDTDPSQFDEGNNDLDDDLNTSQENEGGEPDEPPPKRQKHPGRKKTRRLTLWKRNIAHKSRNEGKSYIDRKGKRHGEKMVRNCIHECRFKCNNKIDEEKRQDIFNQFWKLGDWELQTAFLGSSLKVEEPIRKKKEGKGSKSLSCQFYLIEHRVCKKFFIATLDVSNRRLSNIITKKKQSGTCITPRDRRGHKVPGNRISEAKVEFAIEHIRSFPRYSSHYSRTQAPNKKYLNSNLNITKLCNLYKERCTEQGVEPVKDSYYRFLFNTHFNLSFHKPHTDTCATCDKLQNTIENGEDCEKEEAKTQKELHLRKAEAARQQITEAKREAKEDPSHLAICFDLQKMLPSPVLTCSKVYYSRQLWTYNFCVHNLATGSANMFMWHEGQAARGCEEMLSCLLRLINSLPTRVTKITMFSDNAGGQNKSRFTVKFWLYIVKTTHILEVNHKFLLSGHSYNDCDKNFGIIERKRKHSAKQVFVPGDWMDLVAKSSDRFFVNNMENKDFISLDPLDDYYFKTVKGIRQMQWLLFKKSHPDTLFHKSTFNPDMPFTEYNMKPKEKGPRPRLQQQLPTKISYAGIKASKYKDLQELLQFVPSVHHQFYKALKVQGGRANPRRGQPDQHQPDNSVEDEVGETILDSDSD